MRTEKKLSLFLISSIAFFAVASFILYFFVKQQILQQPNSESLLQNTKTAFLVFTLLLGSIIFLTVRYLRANIFDPMEKISTAMEEENTSTLQNIKTKSTTLGKIANKIDLYFNQKQAYKKEIQSRIQTENELKSAVEEIEHATLAKARAENATGAKSEFLSTMSHEIRTPLNGVIGVVNLLKDEKLTERQKEYVDILSYSSKHLVSLVSDILDFTKIEKGKIDLEISSFNLQSVCESIHHLYKITANDKKIKFNYTPDPQVSYSIYGDSVRLSQILTNLVGNAIKFTQEGTVNFSYRQIATTTKSCTIEFTVTDTGIGIEEDEQGQIFDGFSQANNKIAGTFGGSGLGLSICKKLIELQGGKLNMESVIGQGTKFYFCLAFETSPYEVLLEPAKAITYSANSLQGMKALVAEDNNINALVLKRFLEKWGVLCTITVNGKEAVETITKDDFDIVLMDIHMPVMNGEEATKQIRALENKKVADLPIIALTATASADVQKTLMASGFSNYLSKPFNPESLFRLLKKYY